MNHRSVLSLHPIRYLPLDITFWSALSSPTCARRPSAVRFMTPQREKKPLYALSAVTPSPKCLTVTDGEHNAKSIITLWLAELYQSMCRTLYDTHPPANSQQHTCQQHARRPPHRQSARASPYGAHDATPRLRCTQLKPGRHPSPRTVSITGNTRRATGISNS